MSDEARQYLRAAQEAETRGDKPQAVELLVKAAAVYRSNGSTSRALQMLRHASRLDATRLDLAEQVRRLEWIPETPMTHAVDPGEEERAVAPLDELERPGPEERRLIERGPTRADTHLNAWCSFCCRPRGEVGDLVAGPAGAFVCLTCIRESARLLGAPDPTVGAPGHAAPKAAAGATGAAAAVELVGQEEATRVLDAALRLGARCVLVLGPEGTGKTTCLLGLERAGLGHYSPSPSAVTVSTGADRLLVDALERATPAELLALRRALDEDADRAFVLAVRGTASVAPVMLAGDAGELPVYSTRALVEATGGALPPELAERVQAVAVLRPLDEAALVEIGRKLLVRRASELDLSDEALIALSIEAARSGRGGHELRALLSRIPAGGWALKTAAAAQEALPLRATAVPQSPPAAMPPGKRKRGKRKDEAG